MVNILTVSGGSSSIRFALFASGHPREIDLIETLGRQYSESRIRQEALRLNRP